MFFLFGVNAVAEDSYSTRASYYLDAYSAYIYAEGNGDIEIWFDVTGTGTMDEIGALSIILKESTDGSTWSTVQTYKHEDYSNMLGANEVFYTSHVDYSGVSGRYYKAYVTIWAGEDGNGDSRQITTRTITA